MAKLYIHKQKGYRTIYTVYFPDGTSITRSRYSKSKGLAHEMLNDLDSLETLSARQKLTPEQITYAMHQKYISRDEARRLLPPDERLLLYRPEDLVWEWDKDTPDEERKKKICMRDIVQAHYAVAGTSTTQETGPQHLPVILRYFRDQRGYSPLEITEEAVKDFKAWFVGQGYSKNSFVKYLHILRIIQDKLVGVGLLKENYSRKVKPFTKKEIGEKLPRIIYPVEMPIVIKGIGERTHLLYGYFAELMFFYLLAGLRRRELILLESANLHMPYYILVQNEGGIKSSRKVDAHPFLQMVHQSVLRKNGANCGRYFFGGKNIPLCRPDSVTTAFARFREDIGLADGISLKSLRHSFATYLLKALAQRGDLDIKYVMNILGHSQIATTQRYLHMIPTDKAPVAQLDILPAIETDFFVVDAEKVAAERINRFKGSTKKVPKKSS